MAGPGTRAVDARPRRRPRRTARRAAAAAPPGRRRPRGLPSAPARPGLGARRDGAAGAVRRPRGAGRGAPRRSARRRRRPRAAAGGGEPPRGPERALRRLRAGTVGTGRRASRRLHRRRPAVPRPAGHAGGGRGRPGWLLDVVGPVAAADETWLAGWRATSPAADRVRFHGRRVPRRSWAVARGAWVGLSLLEDTPAFRDAVPSKLYEYLAAGLAVATTPLPRTAEIVTGSGAGVVVPDAAGLSATLRGWAEEPAGLTPLRAAAVSLGPRGQFAGASGYDELARLAARPGRRGGRQDRGGGRVTVRIVPSADVDDARGDRRRQQRLAPGPGARARRARPELRRRARRLRRPGRARWATTARSRTTRWSTSRPCSRTACSSARPSSSPTTTTRARSTPTARSSAAHDWEAVGVTLREGASIGARSVCVAPVTIGRWALVAAGSVVDQGRARLRPRRGRARAPAPVGGPGRRPAGATGRRRARGAARRRAAYRVRRERRR